jgi:hypothetical protein
MTAQETATPMAAITNPFEMAGTEGTFLYVVLAAGLRGRIGVRCYSPGRFRIRVEPSPGKAGTVGKILTSGDDWKQPGDSGQDRFSSTACGTTAAGELVVTALSALGLTLNSNFVEMSIVSATQRAFPPPAPPEPDPTQVALEAAALQFAHSILAAART